MKHFFILGNNSTLSIAEIMSFFPENTTGEILENSVFLINEKIEAKKLIKKIGGTIKIGKIITEINIPGEIKKEIIKIIEKFRQEHKESETGKFKFGISYYGKGKLDTKKIGITIKKELKENGLSCRFVESREKTLSSVVITQNKLIDKGIEIIIIKNENKLLIGYTESTQLFKELSYRDFGRPARDDKSGMIPPKLAQIMINLSSTVIASDSKTILDPFCGSGTILMEASLMDFKNIIGSDISKKAIDDTKKNMKWLKEKFIIDSPDYPLLLRNSPRHSSLITHNSSSTKISKKLPAKSVDVIVTEPYLGPQRGWHDIKETIKELEDLYSKSIAEFKKILKDDGVIIMIWPQFQNRSSASSGLQNKTNKSLWKFLNPNISGFKIINPIPSYLLKNKQIKLSSKNTITYGREGQKIFREIIILKKA